MKRAEPDNSESTAAMDAAKTTTDGVATPAPSAAAAAAAADVTPATKRARRSDGAGAGAAAAAGSGKKQSTRGKRGGKKQRESSKAHLWHGGNKGGGGSSKGSRDRRGSRKKVVEPNAAWLEYLKVQRLVPDDEWDEFLECVKSPLPAAFRINTQSPVAKHLLQQLKALFVKPGVKEVIDGKEYTWAQPLPWYPKGVAWYTTCPRQALRKHPQMRKLQQWLVKYSESGDLWRQEAVSMIPPLVLDVQPHHLVLDVCAAPGSKTSQLIEMLHAETGRTSWPKGCVVANELNTKRCYMLVHSMKRCSTPSFLALTHDARWLPFLRPDTEAEKVALQPLTTLPKAGVAASSDNESVTRQGHFLLYDRILADVPCSGDGTVRKAPTIWRNWTPNMSNALHILQCRIAVRTAAMLKVGGRMVYSTCTLNPVENEAVVAALLRLGGGTLRLVDMSAKLPGLKRMPGLSTWKVKLRKLGWMDKFENVPEKRPKNVLVTRSMFPPGDGAEEETLLEQLPLCMRILHHHQDTGGFFVALIEKVKPWVPRGSEMGQSMPRASVRELLSGKRSTATAAAATAPAAALTGDGDEDEDEDEVEEDDEEVEAELARVAGLTSRSARRAQAGAKGDEDKHGVSKSAASASTSSGGGGGGGGAGGGAGAAAATGTAATAATGATKDTSDMMTKEQKAVAAKFCNLPLAASIYANIKKLFGLTDDFPANRLFQHSTSDQYSIYLACPIVNAILRGPKAGRLKTVNTGVKVFETLKWQALGNKISYRVLQTGANCVLPYMTKRVLEVSLADIEVLLEAAPKAPPCSALSAELNKATVDMPAGAVVLVHRNPSTSAAATDGGGDDDDDASLTGRRCSDTFIISALLRDSVITPHVCKADVRALQEKLALVKEFGW